MIQGQTKYFLEISSHNGVSPLTYDKLDKLGKKYLLGKILLL